MTGGSHSDSAIPEAYPLIRAARYLGVAPWDLLERPLIWTVWARLFEDAENEAQQAATDQSRES